jgi:hypothetical protein
MTNEKPGSDELVRQYRALRKKEMDYIEKRHANDVELQVVRHEIAELTRDLLRLTDGPQHPGSW